MSTKSGFETGESAVLAEIAEIGEKIDRLNETIQQILAAMERMNVLQEKFLSIEPPGFKLRPETKFPWGDVRIPKRMIDSGDWHGNDWERPETFEQFFAFGRRRLMYGMVCSHVGPATVRRKLDPIFEEHGFGERWMKS